MSDEIAFANTALESFAAWCIRIAVCMYLKIKMQRGIKHVTSKEAKEEYIGIIF